MWPLLSLPTALLPLLWQTASAATPSGSCNNSPALCSKTYDNVLHLAAHDSPFVSDESTKFSTSGNQFYNSTVQLDSGVRMLTAQVHEVNNTSTNQIEWHLCHTDCALLDAGTLSDWLGEIKTWMDANPNDVVTVLLVNSNDADASALDGQYSASGIKTYAYTPQSTTTPPASGGWPTLGSMISANKRLVSFVASLDPSSNTVAPYLLDEFTFAFENPFDITSANNFTCTPDRPTAVQGSPQAAVNSNRMFIMNHFLDSAVGLGIETPDINDLANTNSPTLGTVGGLAQHIATCKSVYSRNPFAVLVDFSNVGPAIQSVDNANGVTQAVGRTNLTTAVPAQSLETTSGGALSGRIGGDNGSRFAFVVGLVVAIVLAGWS